MNKQGVITRNLEQYKLLHQQKKYGATSEKRHSQIHSIVASFQPEAFLDYGAGQSNTYKAFESSRCASYAFDPAIPTRSVIPDAFFTTTYEQRFILCSHVLEHLDEAEIEPVLRDIRQLGPTVFFIVPTTVARQVLPNGENAHATVKGETWWFNTIKRVFPDATRLPSPYIGETFILSQRPKHRVSVVEAATHRRPSKGLNLRSRAANFQNLEGRSVAIVGRAKSLIGSGEGALIDSYDVVVRVNARLPLNPALAADTGLRTSLVYHCRKCGPARTSASNVNVPTETYDKDFRASLSDPETGYTPFTGTVCIFQMLARGASKIYATGMDLYVGPPDNNNGGRLRLSERNSWSYHDPNMDRLLLRELWQRQPDRFIPSPTLAKCLSQEEPLVHYKGAVP